MLSKVCAKVVLGSVNDIVGNVVVGTWLVWLSKLFKVLWYWVVVGLYSVVIGATDATVVDGVYWVVAGVLVVCWDYTLPLLSTIIVFVIKVGTLI